MSILSTAATNAAAGGTTALIDAGASAGRMRLRSADDTLLADVALADPSFGAPSLGRSAANGLPVTGSAGASGTIAKYELTDSDLAVVASGDVGSGVLVSPLVVAAGQTVTVTELGLSQPANIFPLAIAGTEKRYLRTAAGDPFLMSGDAGWGALASITKAETIVYLDALKARGLNTVLVNSTRADFSVNTPAWRNMEGNRPFTDQNDWSTVNSVEGGLYWDHAEWFMLEAAKRGMLVLLSAAYVGYMGGVEGWMAEMRLQSIAQLEAYGEFLGTRFAAHPNIVWVHAGDYNVPITGSPSDADRVRAVYDGLIRTDRADRQHTLHFTRETSSSEHITTATQLAPLCTMDWTYSGDEATANSAFDDWSNRSKNVRPVFMGEARYQFESATSHKQLRAQLYGPMMAGSCGSISGANPRWFFGNLGDGNKGWTFGIATQSWADTLATSVPLLEQGVWSNFFASIDWATMTPDESFTVTDSFGSGNSTCYFMLTPDSSLGVGYFMDATTRTFDLSQVNSGGDVIVEWFDPTDGSTTPDASSPYPGNSGTALTPPANSTGDPDMVVIVRAA